MTAAAAFHHGAGLGMWGERSVLIFPMCLGVSGFRLSGNRLSFLSVVKFEGEGKI